MHTASSRARRLYPMLIFALLLAAALPISGAYAQEEDAPEQPQETGSESEEVEIVEFPVSFEVVNRNDTAIPCEANGETYTLHGVVAAPVNALSDTSSDAVTLVLHGLGYGSFFSNFEEVEGYDFMAKQARAGFTTVAIDRLGYGQSPMPDGFEICFGSHATMAHQIITQLRSGDYTVEGGESVTFEQVVLAGHSVGGLIVEAEAYSFNDIDGLIVLSYSDVVVSDLAMQYAMNAVTACQETGGQPSEGGSPGYVPYGETALDFLFGHFATGNAEHNVAITATEMRNINPCGDLLSFMPTVQTNMEHVDEIDVPVLVLAGGKDAFFPPPAVEEQAALFTGSSNVSEVTVPDTGHALTLHLSRGMFQAAIAMWLTETGVGDQDDGVPDDQRATVEEALVHLAVRGSQLKFPDGANAVALAPVSEWRHAVDPLAFGGGPILFVPDACGDIPGVVVEEIRRLDPTSTVALDFEGMETTVCEATVQAANNL